MNHLFTYQKYIIYISLKFYYPGHKKKYFKRLPLIYQKFPKKSYSMNDTVCHSHRRGTGLVIPTGPFFIFFFQKSQILLLPIAALEPYKTTQYKQVYHSFVLFDSFLPVQHGYKQVSSRGSPILTMLVHGYFIGQNGSSRAGTLVINHGLPRLAFG